MAKRSSGRESNKRPLTTGELITLGCIAIWGIAAGVLAVVAQVPEEIMIVCLALGMLTIAATVAAFMVRAVMAALLGSAALLSVAMVVAASFNTPSTTLLAVAGAVALVVTGCATAIMHQMQRAGGGRGVALASPSGATSAGASAAPGGNHHVEHLLQHIYENTMLSDNAKRVLFREREIAMLKRGIEEDVARGDYGAALTMCDDMANVFGRREEAEHYRQQIEHVRSEQFEHEVQSALHRFDELLAGRDWGGAHAEAARIKRLYPESHQAVQLNERIEAARGEHKSQLEREFLHAAQHEEVERAMALLKELDRYLTSQEAERLREVAQGIVVRHRENLGVQFKLAVADRRWGEAAAIGNTIINEFPNTKMADEVRSMIDMLRMRATQTAAAAG